MSVLDCNNDTLTFSFPEVHASAKCSVSFIRTLRLPDDDKTYPLPPGLGNFPLVEVDRFKDNLSAETVERGGVMLPMYQSEALWLSFQGHRDSQRGVAYPFALKISAGKRSAVTGNAWSTGLSEKDYVVVPVQPWLDGFMLSAGVIRQFIAAPLGAGYTVEEQLTGKAEFGGIQIEAIPMLASEFESRFPVRPIHPTGGRIRTLSGHVGISSESFGGDNISKSTKSYSAGLGSPMRSAMGGSPRLAKATAASMGMAAGGRMKQDIAPDPYGLQAWDTGNTRRVFVHLMNSMSWRQATGYEPPTTPRTAADYGSYNLPWYNYYSDAGTLGATDNTNRIKSAAEIDAEKGGIALLPDNGSAPAGHVHCIHAPPVKKGVKEGNW